MSKYYNPKRLPKYCYDPKSAEPFKLSRSKLELFLECPRCFYIDRRLGTSRPPGYPFTLNSAVDHLLKKEFDIHRAKHEKHPLIQAYKIDAKPANHEKLNDWRENFVGVQYHHKPTNFIVFGAIDDLWINSKNEYIVVDYKATAIQDEITSLDKDYHQTYKRQMDIYNWLLIKNKYSVADISYFIYANGKTDNAAFDAKLEFDISLIAYKPDSSWIEDELVKAHKVLQENSIPDQGVDCDYCTYTKMIQELSTDANLVQNRLF